MQFCTSRLHSTLAETRSHTKSIRNEGRLFLKVIKYRYLLLSLISCSFLLSSLNGASVRADEKMKPEEIVAKHLDSIGSEADRASVKTRVIVGVSKYVRHGPGGGSTEGRVVLASQDEKYMFGKIGRASCRERV